MTDIRSLLGDSSHVNVRACIAYLDKHHPNRVKSHRETEVVTAILAHWDRVSLTGISALIHAGNSTVTRISQMLGLGRVSTATVGQNPVTQDEARQMLALHRAGSNSYQISRQFGRSRSTVAAVIRRLVRQEQEDTDDENPAPPSDMADPAEPWVVGRVRHSYGRTWTQR